ncbi:hypothetical protein Tco_1464730 [Tanacetum coccineum]
MVVSCSSESPPDPLLGDGGRFRSGPHSQGIGAVYWLHGKSSYPFTMTQEKPPSDISSSVSQRISLVRSQCTQMV